MTHGPEKSDPVIVAGKPTNKAERSAAELAEPRTGTKGNADRQSTHWTQSQARVSQALERIRQAVAVTHPRWEPHAGKPHVRICAGGARQLASLPLKRRQFIAGIGSAAAWPVVARSQQPAIPVIGYLSVGSPEMSEPYVAALLQGLKGTGYVEGQNCAIEYRGAYGHFDRFPALVADLIERHVSVIVNASGGLVAAHSATSSIPIVSTFGGDPVNAGFVDSLNHPGRNITGVYFYVFAMGAKRLELLREAVPSARVIAVLINPVNPNPATQPQLQEIENAAHQIGQELSIFNIMTDDDLEPAFQRMVQQGIGAVLIAGDPFFLRRGRQLADLAARYAIPAIDESVLVGGLMSYGPDIADAFRLMGGYVGKILNGANPADLPVIQAVKVQFVINLKTAKTLGMELPPQLLARADEVIE